MLARRTPYSGLEIAALCIYHSGLDLPAEPGLLSNALNHQ